MKKKFSEFYRIQEEKRRRELMSTYDQAMIKWRDYETTYRQTISDLGVEMSDGIFNKFLKGDDVSLSGILSESASKIFTRRFPLRVARHALNARLVMALIPTFTQWANPYSKARPLMKVDLLESG
ncbi:hypothetical protein ABVN80_14555 [Acinetobacter baumannii]